MAEEKTLGKKVEKKEETKKGGFFVDILEWIKDEGWKVGLSVLASTATFGLGYKLGVDSQAVSIQEDVDDNPPFAETETE